jgi:hypothetical protein
MTELFRFFSQILLLLVFISSIKITDATINYKLTSICNEYRNNLSLWVGKRQAVVEWYVDWCNQSMRWFFPDDLNATWNRFSVPLITWVPIECGGISQPGVMKLVNNNTFDGYINQFSDRLKEWLAGNDGIYGNDDDRRAYLRLGTKLDRIE